MKQYLLIISLIAFSFFACKNAYEKELGEVEGLITMVDEIEKTVLSVDTSKAFDAQRKIAQDFKVLNSLNDTLSKEDAFRLDDFYSGKKKIFRFSSNYMYILKQVEFAKKQLNELKQDLNNGLIEKDKFKEYYSTEHASIMDLNMQVNKSVNGVDEAVQKLELNRSEIDKLLEELSNKAVENE